MSIVTSAIAGIAQLSCVVTSAGSSEPGARIVVDFNQNQATAMVLERFEDGTSQTVESNASVLFMPGEQLLIQSDLPKIAWLSDQWKDVCYAARPAITLDLRAPQQRFSQPEATTPSPYLAPRTPPHKRSRKLHGTWLRGLAKRNHLNCAWKAGLSFLTPPSHTV